VEFGVVRGLVYAKDNRALFLQKVQYSAKRSSSLNTLHHTFPSLPRHSCVGLQRFSNMSTPLSHITYSPNTHPSIPYTPLPPVPYQSSSMQPSRANGTTQAKHTVFPHLRLSALPRLAIKQASKPEGDSLLACLPA